MNKLDKFFELLGVEAEEEFKIEGFNKDEHPVTHSSCMFYFDRKGNLYKQISGGLIYTEYIPEILRGELVIVPQPFIPKPKEKFWYINTSGDIMEDSFAVSFSAAVCKVISGNCFRTRNITEDKYQEMKRKYKEVGVDVSKWER